MIETKISTIGEEFVILRSKGETSYIKFLKTGNVVRARNTLIAKGIVVDRENIEELSWESYDDYFVNNDGDQFKAVAKKGRNIRIIFTDTGYGAIVDLHNARAGKVKDVLKKSVYGVGYIGLPDKNIPYYKQAYQLWTNVLKRCYSEKDSKGYTDVSVDDRWLCFENFLADIQKLNGFVEWLEQPGGLKYNLDKDLMYVGNKVYSRYTCCFIPESVNKAVTNRLK